MSQHKTSYRTYTPGLRDLALGQMTLALLLRQPSALRLFLPPLLFLPVGDVVLVLLADQPLVHTAPHIFGALVIAVLSVLAWRIPPGPS
jgi:hypothetical protein